MLEVTGMGSVLRGIGILCISTVAAGFLLGGCEKAQLDEEVKRLCAKDGGIRIYETVKLASDKFDEFGNPTIPSKEKAKVEDDYFFVREAQYLRTGNPEMWRTRHQIVRRADGKIMGESIRYSRRGGDMPGPWHESSFTCPEIGTQPSLEQSVFRK